MNKTNTLGFTSLTKIEETTTYKSLLTLTLYIVLLCGLVTLLTNVFPFSSLVNRVLMGLYLVLITILLFTRLRFATFIYILLLFMLVGIDLILTDSLSERINDIFYLPLWCLNLLFYYVFYDELKNKIFKNHNAFKLYIFLWSVLVFVSLFWSKSYGYPNGVRSFFSFTGGGHRFGQTALLTMVSCFIELKITNKKSYIFLMMPPLICTFFSGARTYFIIAFLFFIFAILKMFRSKAARSVIILTGLIAGLVAVYSITTKRMVDSTSYFWQMNRYGVLHFLTSGRSTFWIIDLEQFFKSPFANILFGRGYNFIYWVNEKYYGVSIWAHNDYINVLVSNGLLGLFMFIFIFILFLARIGSKTKIKFIPLLFFLLIVGFNANFNMVYTYTISNLLTPLFGITMLDSFNNGKHRLISGI